MFFEGLAGLAAAQGLRQQVGIGGLMGLGGQAAQGSLNNGRLAMQIARQDAVSQRSSLFQKEHKAVKKDKTIIQELQAETDEWLKDID